MRLRSLFASAVLLTSTLAAPSGLWPLARREGEKKGKTPDNKYFFEAGGGEVLGHYDVRYFAGAPVSYEVRTDSLKHLVRSYLLAFREQSIETWVAHGTLLGWWWNGQIMPWDWDLDTQVSASTLQWLGDNLNMTMHNYTAVADDGTKEQRRYLLDINPNHVERVIHNGQNVIDARWIDTRNGLFIDITGLAENDPAGSPGVWSCKNYHHYPTRDLFPMRETMFEGVPALVPYSFDKILTQEYSGRALTKTYHEGHRWNPEKKEWLYDPEEQDKDKDHPAIIANARRSPHMPRSLQPTPRSGLLNLLRIF